MKVFFLVQVYVFNFDLLEFSTAILEKGLFPFFELQFHRRIVMEVRMYSYLLHGLPVETNIIGEGETQKPIENSKQMIMTMMVMGSWIIYGTIHLIIRWRSIMRSDRYFNY